MRELLRMTAYRKKFLWMLAQEAIPSVLAGAYIATLNLSHVGMVLAGLGWLVVWTTLCLKATDPISLYQTGVQRNNEHGERNE